jgi:hypothetical protein
MVGWLVGYFDSDDWTGRADELSKKEVNDTD